MKQSDKCWEKVRDSAIELEHKYKDTKAADFVPKVLVAILLELEAEEKSIQQQIKMNYMTLYI